MASARPIYLDHHATTPVDPRVLQQMLPYFNQFFGNASSKQHAFGWRADEAVEHARQQVAQLIGARAKDIVFTSGATEANNLAIRGAVAARRADSGHIVTVTTEHKAVLDVCASLEQEGCSVTRVPVEPDGRVDVDRFTAALRPGTVLASVMIANNEIGVLQPIADLANACHARGVWLHTDAVQAAGHLPVDVVALDVDLASISAHKMYGPKGVGALYVRRTPKVAIEPQVVGGGQERGLRAGTLNVPGIVGLGAASALAREELAAESGRVAALRDRLLEGLRAGLGEITVNGSLTFRLPHNLHVSFHGVDGEALMTCLADEVAVSSGSACASGSREPSHVMTALGRRAADSWGAVRFGLGRGTTADEIDAAVACVTGHVARLRAMSPVATGARA